MPDIGAWQHARGVLLVRPMLNGGFTAKYVGGQRPRVGKAQRAHADVPSLAWWARYALPTLGAGVES